MKKHIDENDGGGLPPGEGATEILRLQQALTKERDRNLRTLADFENYRRRIENDGNTIAEEKTRRLILPLLDVIDDLERALQWTTDTEQPVVKGVTIIYQKLLALLKTLGVSSFACTGLPFDHNLHDAVAATDRAGHEPGTVVDEIRRGYLWNGELLRPAQVRVAE
jgi:molecular chaperone GrpE